MNQTPLSRKGNAAGQGCRGGGKIRLAEAIHPHHSSNFRGIAPQKNPLPPTWQGTRQDANCV